MKEKVRFFKMVGGGNDFIIIDNRAGMFNVEEGQRLAKMACRRKFSVGADGLILIENDKEVDFSWTFFNSDGSIAEMCGNGARCAARFCYINGIVQNTKMTFRTLAGLVEAEVSNDSAKVRLPDVTDMQTDIALELHDGEFIPVHFVNTGVPHVVVFLESLDELESFDVPTTGRIIRYHDRFQPAGTNVNFAYVESPSKVYVRTYERGVEDETLACGTGSIAVAVIGQAKNMTRSPVSVQTKSGEILTVYFTYNNGLFENVFLEGPALVSYEGFLWPETI